MVKAKAFFLCLISFLAIACGSGPGWKTSTVLYFDTVCQIRLFCSKEEFIRSNQAVEEVFSEIERLFSPEVPFSNSDQERRLLKEAFRLFDISGGIFDITVAPLSKIWGFADKNYRVPSPEEIQKALGFMGMGKIPRPEMGVPVLLPAGMSFDWGGIAKGFGVDRAVSALLEMGITRGFINCGGDLFCWGNNPGGSSWKIGIQHPRGGGFLGILELSESAAATTGDYQRFFEEGGTRYHHVFNPKTGYPSRGMQSVTVAGPETMLCDALSTVLFISGTPMSEDILRHYPEYGAVLVDERGRISEAGRTLLFRLEPR